jgi:hypothetical protein
MNHYFNNIYLYFSKQYFYVLTFCTSLLILLPEIISDFLMNGPDETFFFIYTNFIVTLIIDISTAMIAQKIGNIVSKQKYCLSEFFLTHAYYITCLFIAHVIIKIYKFIIVDSYFFKVNENTGLYPIIFLILFQILFYFIRSYFFPIIVYTKKITFSLKQFTEFSIKNFFSVIQNLLISTTLSFLSIIALAFIFSNIEKIISLFGNIHTIHHIIEKFLEIFFKVSFNHFFILFLLNKNK